MITKERAQQIASQWHSGQTSGLYSFASWSKPHSQDQLKLALFETRREIATYDPWLYEGTGKGGTRAGEAWTELVDLQRYLESQLPAGT